MIFKRNMLAATLLSPLLTLAVLVLLATSCRKPQEVVIDAPNPVAQSAAPGGKASSGATETDAKNRIITRLAARTLEYSHYRKQALDDGVSSRIFDEYFDLLDPNHLFFTLQDIARFEPYRLKLDDQLKDGDAAFAFEVYDLYRKRMADYRAFAEAETKKGLKFTGNDEFIPDRRRKQRPADDAALRKLWLGKLKNDVLYYRLLKRAMEKETADGKDSAVRKLWDRKSPEEKVATRLRDVANDINKMSGIDILGIYLTAVAQVYGPHSAYLSPRTEEDFDIDMKLSLSGIGATLTCDDGYIRVVEIVPGGPADKNGQLKAEDRIIAVAQENGEPVDVIDMPVSNAVKLIRGEAGSKVMLTVLSGELGGKSVPKNITITRGKVELKDSACSGEIREVKTADGRVEKIGVITVPSFYMDFDGFRRNDPDAKSCTRDVNRILADFRKSGVDAVVMDMRRNGGGSLQEAITLAGSFIGTGPVVQIRDKRRNVSVQYDEDPACAYDGPLVVLLSKMSASATEIFAGAMQDYGRALIVGDSRSYGKGTVLEVRPLEQMLSFFSDGFRAGSLKYESAVFYRISGGSVQQLGITPDIQLPSFTEALEMGEMYSDNHLPWDSVKPVSYAASPRKVDAKQLAALKQASAARIKAEPEFERLAERVRKYEELRTRNSVSLNEEKRWSEYMKEKDLEDAAEAAELGSAVNPPSGEPGKNVSERDGKKGSRDILLEEASHIAADLVKK